jgi:hypothetical protein
MTPEEGTPGLGGDGGEERNPSLQPIATPQDEVKPFCLRPYRFEEFNRKLLVAARSRRVACAFSRPIADPLLLMVKSCIFAIRHRRPDHAAAASHLRTAACFIARRWAR